MWCQHCAQDVPAVSAQAGVPAACSRCGGAVTSKSAKSATKTAEPDAALEPSPEWASDQRMRHIGRTLRTPISTARPLAGDPSSLRWIDMPQFNHAESAPRRQVAPSRATRARRASDRRMQWIAWLALSVGLGLAAGGAGLVGMGMFGSEPIFWQWGVAVTLAGQAILIGGLVRVLLSLWSSSRAANRRLSDLQQELSEVGRTAEAIIAQRPGGPSGFYGELARGASPALLLANLKGQVDHLATRLHA